MLYDSRVSTQMESISQMEMKSIIPRIYAEQTDFQVVQLDVRKDKLPANFPVNKAKVSSKDNPSVILRVDDSLHKLPPNSLHSLVTFN